MTVTKEELEGAIASIQHDLDIPEDAKAAVSGSEVLTDVLSKGAVLWSILSALEGTPMELGVGRSSFILGLFVGIKIQEARQLNDLIK